MKVVGAVIAVIGLAVGAGCASGEKTWTGTFFTTVGKVDFYEEPIDVSELKVVCSEDDSALTAVITAPDGTQASSTRPADGAQTADIEVSGGNGTETLQGAAVWKHVNGDWGFEGDPGGAHDNVLDLRGAAAICPNA